MKLPAYLPLRLSISHNEWTDFFDSSNNYVSFKNKNESFGINVDKSYYISLCLFIYLNETGAIRISSNSRNTLKFLIDTSSFDNCLHKNEEGGSLYINANQGECVQDRVCSIGSKTPSVGTYCSITASPVYPNRDYILETSIIESGEENTSGNNNMLLLNGEIHMKSINLSYSKLDHSNFYYTYFGSNSNLSFSTFSNNTSSNQEHSQAYHDEASDSQFKIIY